MFKRAGRYFVQLAGSLVAICIVAAGPAAALAAEAPEIKAETAVLMEAHTGRVLYDKHSTKPMPPASIVKVMTLLLSLEALEQGDISWDTMVTVSEAAWRTGGSQMFLEVGQEVSIRDLIMGIAIISANDGTVAIAEHLDGTTDAFVQRMNRRAAELGLENTRFTNTHGIPAAGQQMSALDIARLARYFIQTQPEGHALESEREFTFNDIRQYNRNPLIGKYEGADGLKTGWTGEEGAGYNLVATAQRSGLRLISVVMNNSSEAEREADSTALLDYGFLNYELLPVGKAGDIVGSVPLARGVEREISLALAADLDAVVPVERPAEMERELVLTEPLTAPIKQGDIVGSLQLRLAGEVLNEVDVVAAETVEQAGFFTLLFRRIGDFFSGLLRSIRRG